MKFVSAARFKALAATTPRKDFAAADLVVRKLFTVQPELLPLEEGDPNAPAIRFTITTGALDRDDDTISVDGWQLTHYERNPVVLWGHDAREPPIGRSRGIIREGGALKSDVEFVPMDVPIYGARAEGIRQMCARGFLHACSVGFRPLEFDISEDEKRGSDWFPGIDFKAQELMEWSIVSVPANPEALIDPVVTAAAAAAGDGEEDAEIATASAAIRRAKQFRLRTARLLELT